MTEFGLWTRRALALMVFIYVGWLVYKGEMKAQDVKEMALIVIGYYFGMAKENA